MKTIIQKIGPLYGQPVDGSIFGQPNGSVSIPPENKIYVAEDKRTIAPYLINSGNIVYSAKADKTAHVALSFRWINQVPCKIQLQISTTSDFAAIASSIMAGSTIFQPGESVGYSASMWGKTSELTIVNGTTYYVRAALLTVQGDVMAVSDGYEMEGLV